MSRSMKMGGTVTITADIDNVEPLRLLIPMRLSAQLKVRILKTDSGLNEPEIIFDGVVRKPDLQGRRISVSCVEWGDVMDQIVPGFYIQRNCNYRVYDSRTCRASRASKEVAVSVIAKSSRTIIVQAAALTGQVANWFALGWLEVGDDVYTIMSNAAASGNTVTLTLGSTFRSEVPVSAVALPGCDGRFSTCGTKFDNRVNHGGAATPKENLTLVAIKSDLGGGGKK
jgi:hypothetical protein